MSSSDAPMTNGTSSKDALVDSKTSKPRVAGATAATNAVKDHPITQNIVNGPVATSIKNEAGNTASEFNDLAASRAPPTATAANDTPLTHYHSFFYNLLSWKNKRATGITFATALLFIFACRYLPVIPYALKISYMTLGVVTLAEAASKFLVGSSVAGQVRPRRYYKIPKETLEAALDDLENLINFFVIEIQRIIFAENIPVTAAAFVTAFLSYYLIKILPFWGMALLGTTVTFVAPLIYIQNKELIDSQLEHTSNIISQQASQVRDLTAQHTSKSLDAVKSATGSYAAKAQELIGTSTSRQKIIPPAQKTSVKESDFPSAPQSNLPATESEKSASEPIAA